MLKGYTKASRDVIANEANPEDWVTTFRCPREGHTFKAVWHCKTESHPSPWWKYINGYAIAHEQVKDIILEQESMSSVGTGEKVGVSLCVLPVAIVFIWALLLRIGVL